MSNSYGSLVPCPRCGLSIIAGHEHSPVQCASYREGFKNLGGTPLPGSDRPKRSTESLPEPPPLVPGVVSAPVSRIRTPPNGVPIATNGKAP